MKLKDSFTFCSNILPFPNDETIGGERLLFAGWVTTSNVRNRLVRTGCHREILILAVLVSKNILRQERNGKHETGVNGELKN